MSGGFVVAGARLLADYAYTQPFLQPLPVWSDHVWPWLLVPLCAGVAIVYKSIRCKSMKQVPIQAATVTIWIILAMAAAGAALAVLVRALERYSRG